jgi:hypothetical protein
MLPLAKREAVRFQSPDSGRWRAIRQRMRILLLFVVSCSLLTAGSGLVRSVVFQKFEGVSSQEIIQRLNDRDIQLVKRPYDAQNVATAQQIVEELLAEKGRQGAQVKATITQLHGGAVKLTFTMR